MEIDININDVLQEMITFLECLREAHLPLTLENLREKLLIRSKSILNVTTTMMAGISEPYLDMKPGSKSLLWTRNGTDSEEYIGMCVEESQKHIQTHSDRMSGHQDYYETFENERQIASASANIYSGKNDDRDESQMLIGIYKNLSAMQIKSKCYKCGPLFRREGKKLFLSESRACWTALIGSYLLIYRSERHNRPYAIYPIQGYMARPAPNMIPRDRQKSDSAFEMYSPGSETLQFIARTPKDMDQWIAKICEVGCRNKKEREKKRSIVESSLTDHHKDDATCRGYWGAEKSPVIDKSTTKAKSSDDKSSQVEHKNTDERAPPLPARIPRRLPSLPPDSPLVEVLSYRATVEGDDEDDNNIYHRIEDLRNETRYQNMILSKKKQPDERQQQEAFETVQTVEYDDICASNENVVSKFRAHDVLVFQETYDDVITSLRIDATTTEPESNQNAFRVDDEKKEEFYDDVEILIPNRRFAKDDAKDQIKMPSKLEKKSFLDRVLSRRESPNKLNKKHHCKSKVSSNSSLSLDKEKLHTYDDVSDLTSNQFLAKFLTDEKEELPEYNCPPPPRPIYEIKSLTENQNSETRQVYDDVNICQERRIKNNEEIILQLTRDSCIKANEAVCITTYYTKPEMNDNHAPKETEHYQSPKSRNCIHDTAKMEQNEELYDDIALWADFTARQRDIETSGKKESEDPNSVFSDKKAWNRFAINRKLRVTSDFNCSSETNRRGDSVDNEGVEEIESPENNGLAVKRNTFLKLINRMENSFAKVSARSPSSFSTGKSNTSSNNS
ncbi:uncharacterized protein LOC105835166 isoform X2 [Monomorium pharaonis]|nr:uncharacterized protein LOC105835166 isoform X2 [Monomorium pharaonis]